MLASDNTFFMGSKHGLAGRPRKRFAEFSFLVARRLTDQHHRRQHRIAADHRAYHRRAALAGQQRVTMLPKQKLAVADAQNASSMPTGQ